MRTLRKGDLGAEVIELQKLLKIKPDGIFGGITDAAVRSFQARVGLTADGVVGTMTWEKLGKKKPTTDREKLLSRFGDPMGDPRKFEKEWMMTYFCQKEFPTLPFHKIYCNRLLIPKLQEVFSGLRTKNLLGEIREYGGCWNPRYIRGYEAQKILSIHTWALAVDFNVKDNPLGLTYQQALDRRLRPFSPEFQQIWRDFGWVCGIDFKRGDGMHFQLVDL